VSNVGILGTNATEVHIGGRLACTGGVPSNTSSVSANAGTGATISIAGTDMSGVITLTTGTGTLSTGQQMTWVPNTAFINSINSVVVCAGSTNAAGKNWWVGSFTSSRFILSCTTALANSTVYLINYIVIG